MKTIERLSPLGLLLLWTISTAAWLLLYGFSFEVRSVVLDSVGADGLRVTLVGIKVTLAILPVLLMVLTFRWLESDGLARRVEAWHIGQLAGAWFVGGFLAVFVYLGFVDLGAGTETPGLIYLLFFLGFAALVVPALLTTKWLNLQADPG